MVDPHRMMRKYDPAEGFTQPLVHAWFVGVNINAIRCTQHDACITLVGWCAQPLAYAWRAWVNATATRCRKEARGARRGATATGRGGDGLGTRPPDGGPGSGRAPSGRGRAGRLRIGSHPLLPE